MLPQNLCRLSSYNTRFEPWTSTTSRRATSIGFGDMGDAQQARAALLMLLLAGRTDTTHTAAVSCVGSTATVLPLQWAPEPGTDLYLVGVFPTSTSQRPIAVLTAASTTALLEDVLPATAYWLRLRSHPSAAPARVAGWRPFGQATRCATKPARPVHSVRRLGGPHPGKVAVEWEVSAAANGGGGGANAMVSWTTVSPFGGAEGQVAEGQMAVPAGAGRRATITGLAPGTSHWVWVTTTAGGGGLVSSDPVRLETAPGAGVASTEVYRVSEGTHEIDLLENHNSGDLLGESAFLTDSGNFVVPWEQMQTDR